MKYRPACMVCREKETCILPEDDAHIVGKKIQHADALVIGTPTPLPFNFILPENRGAIRAVREVLHYGDYKIVDTIIRIETKKSKEISSSLTTRTKRLGKKLFKDDLPTIA